MQAQGPLRKGSRGGVRGKGSYTHCDEPICGIMFMLESSVLIKGSDWAFSGAILFIQVSEIWDERPRSAWSCDMFMLESPMWIKKWVWAFPSSLCFSGHQRAALVGLS